MIRMEAITQTKDYDSTEKKKIGKTIALLRKSKGLTQKELAECCDVSHVFISHIERGSKVPTDKIKVKIAEALELSVLELDATLYVFSGIPAEVNKFSERQLDFLSSLQKLIVNTFSGITQ